MRYNDKTTLISCSDAVSSYTESEYSFNTDAHWTGVFRQEVDGTLLVAQALEAVIRFPSMYSGPAC